jgi:hypothetical protein
VLKNDLKAANLCYATTCELFRGMLSELLRNSLVIIGKLQASARQVHVKLSEGSILKCLKMTGKLQGSATQVHVNLSEGSILKCLKMTGKLQASARQVHVNLSEGCFLRCDASLCKAGTCKFIRGMGVGCVWQFDGLVLYLI